MAPGSRPPARDHPGTAKLLAAGAAAFVAYRLLRHGGDDIAGDVVLITGGSRGLGLLLAKEFAAHGCRIVICSRDEVQLAHAAEQLRGDGVVVLPVQCDVSDRGQVDRMIAEARQRFGRIDILVNNAGVIQTGPLGSMEIEDFERAMDITFWGSLYTTLAVLPEMIDRRRGRIVNITSIGGKVAVPHLLPYDAAKFALVGLSEGLRAELRKEGVRVTTIIPGLMRTGSPVNALFKGDQEKEFTWFALSSATPLTTMSAERAARRVVLAARRGEAEVTLSWQAKLLRISHDLFPGAFTDFLGLINRALPDGTDVEETKGMHLNTALAPSPLTALLNRAARRNNEFGGTPRPSAEHARKVGLDDGRRRH
jgi:NAD(P)-dependent dehydrogenase (short-subunit alcohol dehydrogenase family)